VTGKLDKFCLIFKTEMYFQAHLMTERRCCHGSCPPGLPRCEESKTVPMIRQVLLPQFQGSKR